MKDAELPEDIDELIEQQGWDEESRYILAEEFIHGRMLGDAYLEFLQKRAREENEG